MGFKDVFFPKQYYNYVHFLRVYEVRLLLLPPPPQKKKVSVAKWLALLPAPRWILGSFLGRASLEHLDQSNDKGNVIGPLFTFVLPAKSHTNKTKNKQKQKQKTLGGRTTREIEKNRGK